MNESDLSLNVIACLAAALALVAAVLIQMKHDKTRDPRRYI